MVKTIKDLAKLLLGLLKHAVLNALLNSSMVRNPLEWLDAVSRLLVDVEKRLSILEVRMEALEQKKEFEVGPWFSYSNQSH